MSNARNLARLLPNASGQLPDAAMASGSVLQVAYQQTTSPITTTSATLVDTGRHTLSITTSKATSKLLVQMTYQPQLNLSNGSSQLLVKMRSSLDGYVSDLCGNISFGADNGWIELPSTLVYLHKPNQAAGTTITYKSYFASVYNNFPVLLGDSWGSYMPQFSTTILEIAE